MGISFHFTSEARELSGRADLPTLHPRHPVSGARHGEFSVYCVPTHIAIFAAFNLPNHFGRKSYPHLKRREFHQVRKPVFGHMASKHHRWNSRPDLCPAEVESQPGPPDVKALPKPQRLSASEKPSTKLT